MENKRTLGYTAMGEAFDKFGDHSPAQPEDFAFTKAFWELSQRSFVEGKLKAHPHRIGKEGLKGVFDGLQQLKEGRVSGEKLVYRVEETP